jgi:hypothetical protein
MEVWSHSKRGTKDLPDFNRVSLHACSETATTDLIFSHTATKPLSREKKIHSLIDEPLPNIANTAVSRDHIKLDNVCHDNGQKASQ